ncbi:MAG: CoB--CoM heterodisulfide reductase iron-sulfur subunit B family protein [archaeon YNP-LCB-003-016]|uniref:CoB--CoM heterodisulfide reductase iron-sulfur subunit B family protein n=1 Tax=Candidatus Culexarchaeum yellowstonense TaxID=2928963 RepID=UPI0026EAD037|nr:CoB--CoM heterodisulfide reductase iron-sulfur subunit B family protein [Candidatus Culexarchaeum yellowstonense]MCR6691070.1 CoB--CoM heterodisulfide reductase iron-sulfur subunit B family protein [Candidatus Culexarchaeum yellowstonense]
MRYILYPGCLSSTDQYQYELSAVNVLKSLNVDFSYAENVNCCGLPLRSVNSYGWVYLSARLMSVLESYGKPCILLCNWCHASLTYVKKLLDEDEALRSWVNSLLAREGLKYKGDLNFKHIIQLLYEDIGLEKLRSNVKRGFKGFKFSIHPGCLYFRPNDIGRPDDSHEPHMLMDLVKILGADAELCLDCCGWSIYNTNANTGLTLAGSRLKLASKTDGIVIACPHGGVMMDKNYEEACKVSGFKGDVPVLYYTQLLGLAIGLSPRDVALNLNKSPVNLLIGRFGI